MKMLSSLLLALALTTACGDDDDHDDDGHVTPAECEAIADGCHESTTEAGMACHENAHDVWTAAECQANEASCFAECGVSPGVDSAVGDVDAGAPDANAP